MDLYWLGNIIGSFFGYIGGFLYYVEVILDNFLDSDKKFARHLSKIRITESARLNKPLKKWVGFWQMSKFV